MLDVHITTVKHTEQRYNTVGDYLTNKDGLTTIHVSELGDHRMEFLIALHELVEVFLCKQAGITDDQIDKFDLAYDANRSPDEYTEPGDNPEAPYHSQHMFATIVEQMACRELGLSWREYDNMIGELMKERQRA